MRAIHGDKAKHDQIDSQKIAARLRGGMLPHASVYPAEMRATRDLLRRRMHLLRKRSALLPHVQHPNRQYHLPEIGKNLAYQANREGAAARFDEAAAPKNLEVDWALITYDERLRDLELSIIQPAKTHEAHTLYLWQTVPGIGKILSLVLRYDIHDMERFPRVQDFASYGRLVTCAKESAGTRWGTSGKNIGNAPLTWAFSEAAVVCLRNHPTGQKSRVRLEQKHDQGTALTILAHQLGRAVSDRLKRTTAFDRHVPACLREQRG
jgi:transposase